MFEISDGSGGHTGTITSGRLTSGLGLSHREAQRRANGELQGSPGRACFVYAPGRLPDVLQP